MIQKIKDIVKKYCPRTALVLFSIAAAAVVVNIISANSEEFSDFFNRYIGSVLRGLLAAVTGILPFSLAETVILFIPVLFASVLVLCIKATRRGNRYGVRYIVSLASVLSLLYSMFVMTSTVAYNGTSLAHKLGLERKPVSTQELRAAAEYMIDGMNGELDNIDFLYGAGSTMPYSISELNGLMLEAYDRASEKYPFIPRMWSRIKVIALSEPFTYTHISGMYTYYTGEANLNNNFPDYNLPFTTAHEFAHQRGIMPEDEANFAAFLVCMESDDSFVRYSAYLNMYEYLNSALHSADYGIFTEVYRSLDARVRGEMSAYNAFFEKYRDNTAADVSGTLNDTYLKFQGESAGEKSYGMVVDLAVAYVNSLNEARMGE